MTHTANILGRTFDEINSVYAAFATPHQPDHFLHLIYWLGKRAINEIVNFVKVSKQIYVYKKNGITPVG